MTTPFPSLSALDIETANLCFMASADAKAQAAKGRLDAHYGGVEMAQADIIIALGGDGLMLRVLHELMARDGDGSSVSVFGMNFGTVGFLMNHFAEDDLRARLGRAQAAVMHPLRMRVIDGAGVAASALAINEIALLRQTAQAARLEVLVDGRVRLAELICDGILLATAAGSTAYNLSAHGPILPLSAPLLALTPISPFRPRRWRGALLSEASKVEIRVLEAAKRPVIVSADHVDFHQIEAVRIEQDKAHQLSMLFDDNHSLEERILAEQFTP